MTVPYIIEDKGQVVILCKGCGEELVRASVAKPTYGDLYLAMIDDDGVLSQHSTPCCPSCAEQPDLNLQEWWDADVLHWFIEERVLGKSPDDAYKVAMKLAGGRRPVRASRYVRGNR